MNVVQTDPTTWGPDADRFRPERWLERKEEGIRHGREIFAFSEGYVPPPFKPWHAFDRSDRPRSCIGKAFAMCEIKESLPPLLVCF